MICLASYQGEGRKLPAGRTALAIRHKNMSMMLSVRPLSRFMVNMMKRNTRTDTRADGNSGSSSLSLYQPDVPARALLRCWPG